VIFDVSMNFDSNCESKNNLAWGCEFLPEYPRNFRYFITSLLILPLLPCTALLRVEGSILVFFLDIRYHLKVSRILAQVELHAVKVLLFQLLIQVQLSELILVYTAFIYLLNTISLPILLNES
jgi:hypothetical protein